MAAHETGRVRRRRDLMALLDVLVGGVTSFLEHRAKTLVFPPAEFPELRWQVPISACGKARTLDIFDAATRTAIELDSHEFHDKVQDRLADMERDAELASIGIQTLHVDFQDVFSRPDWCRTMYRRIRAERLKASTASGTRPQ